MRKIGSSEFSSRAPQKQLQLVIAIAWGAFVGALTFAVGPISWVSPNPIIGAIQVILMALILPGLIGGTAFAGNVHAFSLVPGAIINALLHCGSCWLLLKIRARLKKARANGSAIVALLVIGAALSHAQGTEDAFENARQQYQTGQLGEAERGFRKLVSRDPSNVAAQMYLGQILFREEKFSDAISPYEKVRALEKRGTKLTLTQHRILGDQLAMAYGISGRTADSKTLLQDLIRTDPEYPLNYYNLACVAADENDKPGVLKNLELTFQHKGQILQGEEIPDPASDPSFKKYAQDAQFKALLTRLKTATGDRRHGE